MSEEKLLHLLKKKRGFFEAVLDLSMQETLLSLDEWIGVLKQKKILLTCIEKIDEELTFFKDSLEIVSQEIGDEIDETKKLIKQILEIDSYNVKKRKGA